MRELPEASAGVISTSAGGEVELAGGEAERPVMADTAGGGTE